MYKKANMNLWSGRVDKEDKKLGKRWHQKVKELKYPYKKSAGVCFLGFECDEGVKRNQGRVGAFEGADALKASLGGFACHEKIKLYDVGKIVADENLELSQQKLAKHITKLLKQKHFPIILGGGHEVAFGSFMGLFNALEDKNDIAVINFDAHFDLRETKIATSGTPFNQMSLTCKGANVAFNYFCLGISKPSNTKALFKRAKELNVSHVLDIYMNEKNRKKIEKKLSLFLKNKTNIYISIDTDVFCSSEVFAVSAVASRGVSISFVYEILDYLFKNYKDKIKLIDFAEFNPKYDINDISKKNIARLIYDIVQLKDL